MSAQTCSGGNDSGESYFKGSFGAGNKVPKGLITWIREEEKLACGRQDLSGLSTSPSIPLMSYPNGSRSCGLILESTSSSSAETGNEN